MQLRQSIFMQLIPRCHLRRSYFHATPFHFRPILLHNFAPQQFLHIIHSVVYDTQACGCVNYSVGYDVFNMLTFIVTQRPLGVCLVCTLSPISATLCVSSVHWTSHMCYLGSNATKCWWWTPSDPKSYGCQRAAVAAVVGVQEARTVSLAAGSVHAWLEMDIFLPRSKRNTTSVFISLLFWLDTSEIWKCGAFAKDRVCPLSFRRLLSKAGFRWTCLSPHSKSQATDR